MSLSSWFGEAVSKVSSVVASSETALVGVMQQTVAQFGVGSGEEGAEEVKQGNVEPPWVLGKGMEDKEKVLRLQILHISQEKWMFLESPAPALLEGFMFDMDQFAPVAQECLKLDPQLEKMRWLLVPWKVKEEPFWRNYFGRIYVIKKAILEGKPVVGATPIVSSTGGSVAPATEVDQLEEALKSVDAQIGDDADEDVVALSSMDGLDLEREIAAALNE